MLTFAITTTTKLAGLSLHKNGKYLGEVKVEVAKTHSTTILEQIDRLFEWTGTTLDEVENVLVSIGPGSFTGVRIAIAILTPVNDPGPIETSTFSTSSSVVPVHSNNLSICSKIVVE